LQNKFIKKYIIKVKSDREDKSFNCACI